VHRWSRRRFLESATLAALGASRARTLSAQTAASQTPPPAPVAVSFTPLRRNVGLFTGRGGTIGWLITPDAVVVVDSQFPDTAAQCLAGLKGRSPHAIDLLVNTHHHADHTSGNPTFKPVVGGILAHERVPELQRQAAEQAGTASAQVYADKTYGKTWEQPFGKEVLRVKYYGPGHTGGDSVVTFVRANVVHMGDLVFRERHPFVDRPAGASVRNWVTLLDAVARDHDGDTIYVFGHAKEGLGVSGTVEELHQMRRYLAAVIEYVEKAVAAGRSRDQITSTDTLAGFESYQSAPPRGTLAIVLGAAFDEITNAAK
jgi:cyclase